MPAREVRVQPNRFLQLRDRFGEARAITAIEDSCGFEEKGIGLRAGRRRLHQPRLLFAMQHYGELLGNGACDSLLQMEESLKSPSYVSDQR